MQSQPHTDTVHAGTEYMQMQYYLPAAPPRRALRPQKGGRLLAAGPQSRIHRNGPFRKPARKRPRAFGNTGPAHSCPSTGLGGACACQSREESEVALTEPVK